MAHTLPATRILVIATLCAASMHAAQQPQQPPVPYGSWGVDLTAMDRTVKPGDDFDRFVNGRWKQRAEIPADQGSTGTFDDVRNRSQAQVRAIIEQASPTSQLGEMYQSFMNEAAVEAHDDKPLLVDEKRVAALADKEAFARFMGETNGAFGQTLVDARVAADPANPSMNTLFLVQAGLGMPDRDYYLNSTFKPQLDAYRAYMERTLRMIADPDPVKHADAVIAFETAVANVSWPAADRRDRDKINNPMSVAELQTFAPGLNWDAYLTGAAIAKRDHAIVVEKTAIRDIAALYDRTPLATLKVWEAFQLADWASPYLSKRFVDSRFTCDRTFGGLTELPPRWKRGAALIDTTLGELLGRAYIDAYFPPSSKTTMNDLVANLKVAMASRIQRNGWMSPETKTAALDKLSKMDVMVGYPDKWRDYSGLKIEPDDLYGNVQRSKRFEWEYQLSDLGKPVDGKKWNLKPQTVNAYNGDTENENKIVFPAGILQAPFFDPKADSAVNYGAIGAIIGHEISHGFDDQGRKNDATGAARDWWTKADADRFIAQAKRFGAQYDSYEPVPGMHVNGEFTMGENLADLAGVLVAHDAYRASLKGAAAPAMDGFTGDQRFYLAYAQTWRAKLSEDAQRNQITTDEHSPDRFRIIGPLRNDDGWYEAFTITSGKYYLKPEERTRIW